MTPVIALVGRPNVGKSTLFNRFTRSRDALVADFSGLTRDRKYGDGRLEDRPFIVIDTGGVSGYEEGLDAEMAKQSFVAIDEADIVMFLVDGMAGISGDDQFLADHLRKANKPIIVVVNKTDGRDPDIAAADFFELGLGEPVPISASNNHGVRSLLEDTLAMFPAPEDLGDPLESDSIRLAIIGRPNVGKSTLVNRLLGEERVVVFDQPGTTMDSIYIPYERHGKQYMLIDTAGVRRRKNITEAVEKFSIVKTLQAIQDGNVVVLLIDAQVGLVDQDMHMLGFALESGRALVIAVNKWDGLSEDQKEKVRVAIDRKLPFLDWADIHFISAKHGTNVGHLYESIDEAYTGARSKWSTNQLTTLMQGVSEMHQPPLVGGRRIKLRYAHQGGSNPPIIVIHGNQIDKLPGSYKRYLENAFRKALRVRGTPIRFHFRVNENPYDDVAKGRRTNDSKKHKGRYSN
ncbi:MAG: ribosome biogenesis GTPase Der [Reinekea forsetii]|jgi:GTP-binding protein|uniref:GTPase Der n=2 Tax=Reinekea TaxID=230494 RepID=A0A2K8KSX7_9GAMM|nr:MULTISPECIES: ribosome biogenesis GTPase Der [Reinekea]ATX77179.1 GTP-binding protein Der [Reinekea forsetii]MDO7641875.1 ribosome biogenesis GTPase Der [Reinekea forsetii]MDO7673217.1 ribosome biogenesis GTPase Der [Reinekea forsetii]